MKIPLDNLKQLVSNAFDEGINGSMEEKNGVIQSLLTKCYYPTKFKFFTLIQLLQLAPEARLFHPEAGEGRVIHQDGFFGVVFHHGRVRFEITDFWSYPLAVR